MATRQRDPIFAFSHGGPVLKPPEVPSEDVAISEARLLLRRREAEFFAANAALERCPDFLRDERESLVVDVREARQRYFEVEDALLCLNLPPLERAERAVLRADRVRQKANAALRAWRPSDGQQSGEELQKLRIAVRDAQNFFNTACERMCHLKNEGK